MHVCCFFDKSCWARFATSDVSLRHSTLEPPGCHISYIIEARIPKANQTRLKSGYNATNAKNRANGRWGMKDVNRFKSWHASTAASTDTQPPERLPPPPLPLPTPPLSTPLITGCAKKFAPVQYFTKQKLILTDGQMWWNLNWSIPGVAIYYMSRCPVGHRGEFPYVCPYVCPPQAIQAQIWLFQAINQP